MSQISLFFHNIVKQFVFEYCYTAFYFVYFRLLKPRQLYITQNSDL